MGNFGELFGQLKSIGSLCCVVCSKMDHSVVNNSITTTDCNVLDWAVSRYIVSVKNPPLRCDLLSYFPDHLYIFKQLKEQESTVQEQLGGR